MILELLDADGQEGYTVMRERYMREGDGFLLVYSIAHRGSFEEVRHFRRRILRVKDKESFPLAVVGNTVDQDSEEQREVSQEEGQKLAEEFGCLFVEINPRSRVNIEKDLVRQMRQHRRELHG